MRSSSGWSTSVARACHGWKVTVPRLAAQATSAAEVTQSASADRPEGNDPSRLHPVRRILRESLLIDLLAVDAVGKRSM